MPCYKLGLKFGRADIIKRFLASRRTGFYFAVVREGMVGAGDAIELIGREQQEISVADITRVYAFERNDVEALRRGDRSRGTAGKLERLFSAPARQAAVITAGWRGYRECPKFNVIASLCRGASVQTRRQSATATTPTADFCPLPSDAQRPIQKTSDPRCGSES
jgi:hypothetical protein